MRTPSGGWMRCGRSWGLSSEGAGGRGRAGEGGGGVLREGQTFGGEGLLIRYVNFVKLPHRVRAVLRAPVRARRAARGGGHVAGPRGGGGGAHLRAVCGARGRH